jgi:hypothetical protein
LRLEMDTALRFFALRGLVLCECRLPDFMVHPLPPDIDRKAGPPTLNTSFLGILSLTLTLIVFDLPRFDHYVHCSSYIIPQENCNYSKAWVPSP